MMTRKSWLVIYSLALLGFIMWTTNPLTKSSKYEHKNVGKGRPFYSENTPETRVNINDYYGVDNDVTTIEDVSYYQNISECLCSKRYMYPPSSVTTPSLNSSCSDEGTFYQSSQNVVSFSLYLKPSTSSKLKREYMEGLLQNLDMTRKHYPGYSLRLYTNLELTPSSPEYCTLACSNEDLFWCNMRFTPSHGDLSGMVFRTWRFIPLGDPTVDIFLSRDLDSLISFREAAVLEDWLAKGDKAIFLMRDRKVGHNVPILAGMWGASNNKLGMDSAGKLRENIIELSISPKGHDEKSRDQEILKQTVFKLKSQIIVAYDSYNCDKWAAYTEVRPFPTRRMDPTVDFVGNRVNFSGNGLRHTYTAMECPVICRPQYGKDWNYC